MQAEHHRYPPLGPEDRFPFGKYNGCKVLGVASIDGQYVLWLQSKGTAFTEFVIEVAEAQEATCTQWFDEGQVQAFQDLDDLIEGYKRGGG